MKPALAGLMLLTAAIAVAPVRAEGPDRERRVRIVLGCLVQIAEWPVRLMRNHLVVDGTVNGNKVGVMLDTGAMQTLTLRSQADRLRLPRSQSGASVTGVGGRSKLETVLIDEV